MKVYFHKKRDTTIHARKNKIKQDKTERIQTKEKVKSERNDDDGDGDEDARRIDTRITY